MSKNRKSNREWLLDQLGRRCVWCGWEQELELDHIDPFTRLARGKAHYESRAKAEAELPLLQVLCRDCHLDKSREDRAAKQGCRVRWQHGTTTGYYWRKCRCTPCRNAMRRYLGIPEKP